ncbi:hypothetical protein KEG38_33065 [Polyangium jinanense]|uniref:hypothetical protein n=1 Tax=Polyangium jinanense TaxID=2829994 RepID=UPI00234177C6|nr:hypothetical protein [Polyangium jinanense]MDC3958733.1 hypothetical protein [Polyangium jinanense]
MRRRTLALVPLVALALASTACDETSDTDIDLDATTTVPTSIVVDPSLFLGDVPCSAASGAMQSYVATVLDVTDVSAPFPLPSSPPITCTASVIFRQILVGHAYRVQIDGYDVPAAELTPIGGSSSGSRSMVRRAAPAAGTVAPVWSTFCEDLTAQKNVRSTPKTCEELAPLSTETGVLVNPRATLAGTSAIPGLELTCTQASLDPLGNPVITGDVASFDVRPTDPALAPLVNLPCTSPAPAPYTQNIKPGQSYGFRVEARAVAGGPVTWGASCTALAVEGLVVHALCDPLSKDGALDLSLADVFAAAGTSCAKENVVTYDAVLGAPGDLEADAIDCSKPIRFTPIAPGAYADIKLVGRDAAGAVAVTATCTAEIAPGAVSTATCTLTP